MNLSWTQVALPFRHAFAHASATRREAQNVIVRVEADGHVGLGEGCPRAYVTGETPASVVQALDRWAGDLKALSSVADLRRWLDANRAEVDRAPSAACAAELALLDLFARREGVSVETLLDLPPQTTPLQATAVYGSAPWPVFTLQRLRFQAAGMTASKLKLTGDPARDLHRARALSRRGLVRVDANNLWPDAEAAIQGLRPLTPHVWAVEEPVAAHDWLALATVARETGLVVILDESLDGLATLDALPSGPTWVANLRLSRLGGLTRTLEVVAAARARGLELILGAHVGETSLLARAALATTGAIGPVLRGYEGAYGEHLLRRDAVSPTLTFDAHGQVTPGRDWRLDQPGWGLDWVEPADWTAL